MSWYLKVDGIVRTEVTTQPSSTYGLLSSYVICQNAVGESYMQMSSFVETPAGEKGMMLVAADANACETMSFTASTYPSLVVFAWYKPI